MSGIWGYIKLKKTEEDLTARISKVKGQMLEPYKECAIDRFEEKEFDNGFFSCGIQYFNKRARNEVLPFYDDKDDVVFTADVVLNGRQKLVDELQKSGFSEVSMETPDGELA